MSWYNEAIFYHIYPLGLTGAPAQNDYGAPAQNDYVEYFVAMDR